MAGFMTVFGIWLGFFLTMAIYSFLYKDNPFYKVAEQIFIGLSAGYWFVYTIYNILIPNLFNKLAEAPSKHYLLIIPGILGLLMLTQLTPKSAWLSRYPISLMIGTTAGIGMVRYLSSDVIKQATATMINPFVAGDFWSTIGNLMLVTGTLTGIVYFFFSKKHEGVFGGVAKTGVYFLMISFGAAFGYTAMARISLLIGRVMFLKDIWFVNLTELIAKLFT
ncbi:MAG: hypothetical protein K8S56_03965 [Candidatus Cloacimonetes bacterium]|nr:hypothetical protein [Candidatus Cloacimonadota bacterium]